MVYSTAGEKLRRTLGVCGETVLHVLFPNTCLHCRADLPGRRKEPLCESCEKKIKLVPGLFCKRCGVPLPDGGAHCRHCRGYKAELFRCEKIRSAVEFTPEIRSVIHHFKYRNKKKLAHYLGILIRAGFERYAEIQDCDYLVAVPLSKERLKERGFNQSLLLAEKLSPAAGVPVLRDVLSRKIHTKTQTALNKKERLLNMSDAFEARKLPVLKGKAALLIDDVATTGATLEACAKALKKAGFKTVKALTVARE